MYSLVYGEGEVSTSERVRRSAVLLFAAACLALCSAFGLFNPVYWQVADVAAQAVGGLGTAHSSEQHESARLWSSLTTLQSQGPPKNSTFRWRLPHSDHPLIHRLHHSGPSIPAYEYTYDKRFIFDAVGPNDGSSITFLSPYVANVIEEMKEGRKALRKDTHRRIKTGAWRLEVDGRSPPEESPCVARRDRFGLQKRFGMVIVECQVPAAAAASWRNSSDGQLPVTLHFQADPGKGGAAWRKYKMRAALASTAHLPARRPFPALHREEEGGGAAAAGDDTRRAYEVAACTMVAPKLLNLKWADDLLVQWVEYHAMLGVGHFYVYLDHHPAAPKVSRTWRTLEPYIAQGLVTAVEWPVRYMVDYRQPGNAAASGNPEDWSVWDWVSPDRDAATWPQVLHANDCRVRFGARARWLWLGDVDEFLTGQSLAPPAREAAPGDPPKRAAIPRALHKLAKQAGDEELCAVGLAWQNYLNPPPRRNRSKASKGVATRGPALSEPGPAAAAGRDWPAGGLAGSDDAGAPTGRDMRHSESTPEAAAVVDQGGGDDIGIDGRAKDAHSDGHGARSAEEEEEEEEPVLPAGRAVEANNEHIRAFVLDDERRRRRLLRDDHEGHSADWELEGAAEEEEEGDGEGEEEEEDRSGNGEATMKPLCSSAYENTMAEYFDCRRAEEWGEEEEGDEEGEKGGMQRGQEAGGGGGPKRRRTVVTKHRHHEPEFAQCCKNSGKNIINPRATRLVHVHGLVCRPKATHLLAKPLCSGSVQGCGLFINHYKAATGRTFETSELGKPIDKGHPILKYEEPFDARYQGALKRKAELKRARREAAKGEDSLAGSIDEDGEGEGEGEEDGEAPESR